MAAFNLGPVLVSISADFSSLANRYRSFTSSSMCIGSSAKGKVLVFYLRFLVKKSRLVMPS